MKPGDLEEPYVRQATSADAEQIAQVQVNAWRWAYQGQVPDDALNALSVPDSANGWRSRLSDLGDTMGFWVADGNGLVVGFAFAGPTRDDDAVEGTGEVYAIYLERAHLGTGLGRRMFETATQWLKDQEFRVVTVWVLDSNRQGRRFYEAAGLRFDGSTKTQPFGSFIAHEVRYRRDLV